MNDTRAHNEINERLYTYNNIISRDARKYIHTTILWQEVVGAAHWGSARAIERNAVGFVPRLMPPEQRSPRRIHSLLLPARSNTANDTRGLQPPPPTERLCVNLLQAERVPILALCCVACSRLSSNRHVLALLLEYAS